MKKSKFTMRSQNEFFRQLDKPTSLDRSVSEQTREFSLRVVNTSATLTWDTIRDGAMKTNEQLYKVEY